MTLDEAIKIETIHNDHNPNYTNAQRYQAHQLALEALQRIQVGRNNPGTRWNDLLPGETKQ